MSTTSTRTRARRGGGAVAALAIGAAACGSSYVYRPQSHATAEVHGRPAADYPLPPDAPVGDVRVASFGVAKITPRRAPVAEPLRALHVRLVIANDGAGPWLLDTGQQRAQLHDGTTLAPAYAQSDNGELPQVRVEPGTRRTVDLFFPLPPGREKASKIPEFDVVWRVQVGPQAIAQRTPFERLAVEPVYAGAYGWGAPYPRGPVGWYNPEWGPGWIGPPGWYW